MYNNKYTGCGLKECMNCHWCLDLDDIYVCLAHRIQIVPQCGLSCYKWMDEDWNDDLSNNNAVDRQVEAPDHIVPTTE